MSAKMLLLYVRETGHVLAALTVAADPGEGLKARTLTGDALLVRYAGAPQAPGPTEIFVAADQFEVTPADYDAATVASPRDFFVKEADGQKVVTPLNLSINASVTDPPPNLTQVRVNASVPAGAKVWIQLVGPAADDIQVATGQIAAGKVNINVKALKPSTDYTVLALVAGLRGLTGEITTPAS